MIRTVIERQQIERIDNRTATYRRLPVGIQVQPAHIRVDIAVRWRRKLVMEDGTRPPSVRPPLIRL